MSIPGILLKNMTRVKAQAPSKSVMDAATTFSNKNVVNQINQSAAKHKNYLKNIGVGPKLSHLVEDNLNAIVSSIVSPKLASDIQSLGRSKVALELLKNEGKDYGKMEDLTFVKAACILGTRMAMINRDYGQIISGLQQLKDL